MANDVTMPRLSDSMEEGTILKWLVSAGDEVKRGQDIVEIETDKANMTYESDGDGTLVEIVAQEGDTLPIGEVIARIGEAGEAPADSGAAEQDSGDEERTEATEEPAQPGPAEKESHDDEPSSEEEPKADAGDGARSNGAGTERVKASPVARRMASDVGVELAQLEGSGPGGRIVKADVEAAAKSGGETPDRVSAPAAGEDGESADAKEPTKAGVPEPRAAGEAGAKGDLEVQELTRLQQTVSRRMAESKATAPDYALQVDVDMSRCVELRERLKEVAQATEPAVGGEAAAAPSFNDMIVKACATALRENPRVNGAYRDGRFERYSRVNVGVAVAAQDTLVVPTLFDADQRSLGDIARRARELIGKVRDGKITPPELSGGTFTVSNLGMYGIDSFTAVINPPQAAILTVGALKKKPVVDDGGRVVARETVMLTLVSDHRILYGADGARFLARVRELLEQPLALAL